VTGLMAGTVQSMKSTGGKQPMEESLKAAATRPFTIEMPPGILQTGIWREGKEVLFHEQGNLALPSL